MTRRVVVTGLGMVSPLGNDLETSWQAALRGESGVELVTSFDASILGSQIAGTVKNFDATKYLGVKEVRRFDRFVHFGVAAGIMALEDSKLEITDELSPEIGVAIGAGIGGIPVICANYDALRERGPRRISPFMIPGCIINMVSGQLAIMKNLKGPNIAHVTACSTGLHAIGEAMHIIRRGDATVMIAGGAESTIHPLAMGAFDAMHALSRRNDDPKTASRPFDTDRDGFVMGEGAGVVILETLEHAQKRGAKIYGELVGYGISADAYHLTAPDPEGRGAARCMKMALEHAGMKPEDIDYVNTHGTSTPLGDICEIKAIKAVFGDHAKNGLLISSTKSMTGHMLGAAGAVEAIASVMALYTGILPPTIHYEQPDPACDLDYLPNHSVQLQPTIALSDSLGFGGHNGCLAFTRV